VAIEGIGIIGANRRSLILANHLALNGFQIRIYDNFRDSLNMLNAKLKWNFKKENRPELLSNIETIQDYSKFKGADLIIETTEKSFEERFLYFSKIMIEVGSDCIIAVDTFLPILSSLENLQMLPAEKIVGLNFSEVFPCAFMEVSSTEYTDVSVTQNFVSFIEKLGVKYSVISDKAGGLLERLTRVYINAAFDVLSKGKGNPSEIDASIKGMTGSKYGPFEFLDIVGIDDDYNAAVRISEMLPARSVIKPNEIELKLLQYGHTGRKSNLGIYIYEAGEIVGENPVLPSIIKYLGLRTVDKTEIFSDIMIPILSEAKEIAKEMMIGEQDIENVTKLSFGWNFGISGFQKKFPELFITKEKSEFDNLDTF
jgi:3-hydroxyacyl-CoA dehydrogenase